MKVLMRGRDLSDEYLRFAQQIGADGLDIHHGADIPGCSKQGYPDREGLQRLMDRLSAAGLGVYRVAPIVPLRYLHVESEDVQCHEVVITEGVGEGNKYLHNLDSAAPLS